MPELTKAQRKTLHRKALAPAILFVLLPISWFCISPLRPWGDAPDSWAPLLLLCVLTALAFWLVRTSDGKEGRTAIIFCGSVGLAGGALLLNTVLWLSQVENRESFVELSHWLNLSIPISLQLGLSFAAAGFVDTWDGFAAETEHENSES